MTKSLVLRCVGLATLVAAGSALACLALAPVSVVRQTVHCPKAGSPVQGFQLLSTHAWAQGIVVLYRAACPSRSGATLQPVFGYQVVRRQGATWQVISSDSYKPKRASRSRRALIEYGISQPSQHQRDRYTILYGQTKTPKVAAIEATLDTGQVLRNTVTEGGFALIAAGAKSICEIRILGRNNQILQQETLYPLSQPLVPTRLISHSVVPNRCVPGAQGI